MHFKLIIALTEDSITNKVVDAAREKGATGSTVISSARGEGIQVAKTFLGLSLETQRDVIPATESPSVSTSKTPSAFPIRLTS
jgi:hypothetical protein